MRVSDYNIYVGKKFNQLTVLSLHGHIKKRMYFLCKCDCGKEKVIYYYSVIAGIIKRCGCVPPNKKHGKTNTKIYSTWESMINRCYNNGVRQKHYKERGIIVCERWKDFINFYEDMGDVPAGMTLDRIDVNGNYCKENCRWADVLTQNRNRTNTVYVEIDGIKEPLQGVINRVGINRSIVDHRVRVLGWGYTDAIFTPVKKYKKHKNDTTNNRNRS